MRFRHQRTSRFRRVVAAEVDRLAHLGERIVERLAALVLQQRQQGVAVLLVEIGGPFERRGALLDRPRRPGGEPLRGRGERLRGDRLVRLRHLSDRLAVDRRQDGARGALRAPRRRSAQRPAHPAAPPSRRPQAAPPGSHGRRTRRPRNSSAPAHRGRAARECADAAHAKRPRSTAAAAAGSRRPAPPDRPRPTRTRNSRRSPAGAAPDRRAGRDVRRPARRRGRPRRSPRRSALRRAPRPCRAGAGIHSPRRRRPARSRSPRSAHCAWRTADRAAAARRAACRRRPCRRGRSSPCG